MAVQRLVLLHVLAALVEIGGAWPVWQGVRILAATGCSWLAGAGREDDVLQRSTPGRTQAGRRLAATTEP